MKISLIISILSAVIYFSGCGSNTKTASNSANENEITKPALTAYEEQVIEVAQNSCDCLKPLGDIQSKLEKGEIQMQDYASKMQGLTASLQTCTENMEESTKSKDEMKMDVIAKMNDLCPKIAGVIVPVR